MTYNVKFSDSKFTVQELIDKKIWEWEWKRKFFFCRRTHNGFPLFLSSAFVGTDPETGYECIWSELPREPGIYLA